MSYNRNEEYAKMREAEELEERKHRRKIIGMICGGVAMLIMIIFLCASCTKVPTGYTGIVTTFGRVEDYTFAPGLHWKSPFQNVVKMDNRTQKVTETMQAFSADIQQVDLSVSINYSIDQMTAQNLYRTVGEKYYDTIIYPRLLEDTKAVFSKYTAEDLINNREILSKEITELVAVDIEGKGIVVSAISVQDIDFTDAFTNAVEAKQVAAQEKLTAETEQAKLTMEAEQQAQRQVIKANADAEQAKIAAQADLEVKKIQADAAEYAGLKEAAKNKAIAEWLTPELIKYYYILQWDGKMPVYMLSDETNLMMGLE